jgi:hypothetical protein
MKHTVRHGLDHGLAQKALHAAWKSYSERFSEYNPKANWKSDDEAEIEFSAKGIKLGGTLAVRGPNIEMEMKVPLLLRAFQGKAVQVIDEEINRWVAKAKAGEL